MTIVLVIMYCVIVVWLRYPKKSVEFKVSLKLVETPPTVELVEIPIVQLQYIPKLVETPIVKLQYIPKVELVEIPIVQLQYVPKLVETPIVQLQYVPKVEIPTKPKTVLEMRKIIRDMGIKGSARLNKAQCLEILGGAR